MLPLLLFVLLLLILKNLMLDRVQEADYLKVIHLCQNSIEIFVLLTAADQGGNVATDKVRDGNRIYLVPYRVSSLPF